MKKHRAKQASFEVQRILKPTKRKQLRQINLINMIKSQGIRSEAKLLAFPNESANNGLDDLKNFNADTLTANGKVISTAWRLARAPNFLVGQWQSQMERISSCSLMNYAGRCHHRLWP